MRQRSADQIGVRAVLLELTEQPRPAPWYRSMLFVPGHRRDWVEKAAERGADALIFDLEDSVPADEVAKADAREIVAAALTELSSRQAGLFVRINAWGSGHLLRDLLAVMRPGLAGVVLAKTAGPSEVHALDRVLTEFEADRGLAPRSVEIVPLAETAAGLRHAYEVCACSTRVRRIPGVMTILPGGDLEHALGIESTESGLESLYASSKVVVDARAAGVQHILGGTVLDLDDLDGLARKCEAARHIGADGALVIHPRHVPTVNDVFSPSAERIADAREQLEAMATALAGGLAATRFKGRMIDYAHVRSSLTLLRNAQSVGIDVGDYPAIDLLHDA